MFGAESLPNVKGGVGTNGNYDNTAVVTGAFKKVEKFAHAVRAGGDVFFIMQHSMPPAHHQPTRTEQK